MLKVKHLKKTYTVGNLITKAVNNLSIEFRETEFVAVLGPSGCGKTTFLNLLGALDHPDFGEISLYGNQLSNFNERELDRYRNHSIGFIFQTHNLIEHLNAVENIEMGMTLAGANKNKRRAIALELLDKVGLSEHAYKKPNQLSVGQSQRIAIARALATNPDIILADEPTGSVDSKTAIQIMDLIKEIAKDKLVIMVTHDTELAEKYATRIVKLNDGKIISDSNPYATKKTKVDKKIKLKKVAMSFKASLTIAFRNLKTKLGRSFFTAIASSIGIIGISLIIALAGGVNREVINFQRETNGNYPINISIDTVNLERQYNLDFLDVEPFPDKQAIIRSTESSASSDEKKPNLVTTEYANYVKDYWNENPDKFSGLTIKPKMTYRVLHYTLNQNTNKFYYKTYFQETGKNMTSGSQRNRAFTLLPSGTVLNDLYDLIAGEMPDNTHDPENKTFGILLYVNTYDRLAVNILTALGYQAEDQNIPIENFIGKELLFHPGKYNSKTFVPEDAIKLVVTGIVRPKRNNNFSIFNRGFGYTSDLVEYVDTHHPEIISGIDYINIYPADFNSKNEIKLYLDAYNHRFSDPNDPNIIEYFDRSALFVTDAQTIVNAVTLVLIAFSSISLVVSSIMIATITYTTVIERTKEIGLMRALGARKKDISRIFNGENFFIGLFAGVFGVIVAYILTIPLNIILENSSNISDIASLHPVFAILMVIFSIGVALTAGSVPAWFAAKKDPVEALRVE